MNENDGQKVPRRARRAAKSEQKGGAITPDKIKVMVPKHPGANPDDKEAWRELGPNEPLPDGVVNT